MAGKIVKWVENLSNRVLAPSSVSTLVRVPIDGMSTLTAQVINNGGGQWVYTILFFGRVTLHSEWRRVGGVNKDTQAVETSCTDEGIWSFSVGALVEMAFELTVTSGAPLVSIDVGLSSAPWGEPFDVEVSGGEIEVTDMPDVDPVTATPTAYNVTLTNANTEYSQAMPGNCRGFEFQCRTEADVRYAFVTGKVAGPAAPWLTLKAGDYYYSPPINQAAAPSTLYLATPTAGVIAEIIAWV